MRAENTASTMTQFAEKVALAARGEGGLPAPDSIRLRNLAPTVAPADVSYDICGRRRSPATLRSFRLGVKPANAGKSYPATPPTETEVMRMLKACRNNPAGRRGYALMVIGWRSGLRISETLDLTRADLNPQDGTVFVRCGKGGKTRLVGMDAWGFEHVQPWIDYRYARYPNGPIFCVVQGPTRGQRWSSAAARTFMHNIAAEARIERRVAPHQLRHALACSLAREGQPLHVISKQLGHSNPATTATYLAGISNEECVAAVAARRAPGLVLS